MKAGWTAIAALFLALGLTACGGGGPAASSTSAEAGQSQVEATGVEGGGHGPESDAQGEEAVNFTPKRHRDSGGGSAQFVVKGGDNTVLEFGQEADASERATAARALHDFFDARAEGNWAAACDQIAEPVVESLVKLASRADQAKDVGCATVLEKLTNPAAKSEMTEEAAKTSVGSLRVEGEHSFLIYSVFGKTVLAIPMAREGGEWKVAGVDGLPLN